MLENLSTQVLSLSTLILKHNVNNNINQYINTKYKYKGNTCTSYMTYEQYMNFAFSITVCESTCNLVHAFMCKHFLLQAMIPKLVQLVQISICYTCQLFDLYYLHISALQLFCVLLPICFRYILSNNFCLLHVNSCIHINKTYYCAIDFQ